MIKEKFLLEGYSHKIREKSSRHGFYYAFFNNKKAVNEVNKTLIVFEDEVDILKFAENNPYIFCFVRHGIVYYFNQVVAEIKYSKTGKAYTQLDLNLAKEFTEDTLDNFLSNRSLSFKKESHLEKVEVIKALNQDGTFGLEKALLDANDLVVDPRTIIFSLKCKSGSKIDNVLSQLANKKGASIKDFADIIVLCNICAQEMGISNQELKDQIKLSSNGVR